MEKNPELFRSRIESALVFERASATPMAKGRKHEATRAPRATLGSDVARLSLGALQHWFQTVVTHPESVEAGAAVAGEAPEHVILAGAQISATEGLGVYHYAYRARLIECLIDDYPALNYALGAEAFAALAGRYIVQHPSRSPNLNAFGRHMESFCRAQHDPRAGFLGDLARLEWALVEILHAEDAPPLAAEELARIAPEAWSGAQIRASDTLRVCRFEYQANAFFQEFKNGGAPAIPNPERLALAVYRQGFTLWRMVLTPAMADLLEDLMRGVTLGDALSALETCIEDPDALSDAPRDVAAWFSSWVQGGFFHSIQLPDRRS
jgi:hypothetical protein